MSGTPAHRGGGTSPDRSAPQYRIEDLAHHSGATVRTIRAYQDRGLLPKPERRGRSNMYGSVHLTRLRLIADLLERGYSLASIKELLDAWDNGRGLGGVLGLVAEVQGPWTDEEATRISRGELERRFGGIADEEALAEAVGLGVLRPLPGDEDGYLVPSPHELDVAAELHAVGVPLSAISAQLEHVREQVEHIAHCLLEFTTDHVFARFLGHGVPTDADAAQAASLVRRLRPLARLTVDAELARAMQTLATAHLHRHLTRGEHSREDDRRTTVRLPEETMRAVRSLVGPGNADAFVDAATQRELHGRTLDALTATQGIGGRFDQRT